MAGKFKVYYGADYKDKTVLDIGGYIGDTALFFLEKGADHVTIYEPIETNRKLIRMNVKGKNYTIHPGFVSDIDGERQVDSDFEPGSTGFGQKDNGKYPYVCAYIDINKVLEPNYDIVKMDCEGCEYSLLSVPDEDIQKIPYWIIEFHDIILRKQAYDLLLEKFESNNFKIVKTIPLNQKVILIHFSKEGVHQIINTRNGKIPSG